MSSKFAGALRPLAALHGRYSQRQQTRLMSKEADDDVTRKEHLNKYDAREVSFSPTRREDIAHNYTERSHDDDNDDFDLKDSDTVSAYKSDGNVNLYAHMQSNVPEPFQAEGKSPTSLNMPGGGASRSEKYLSGQRQSVRDSK